MVTCYLSSTSLQPLPFKDFYSKCQKFHQSYITGEKKKMPTPLLHYSVFPVPKFWSLQLNYDQHDCLENYFSSASEGTRGREFLSFYWSLVGAFLWGELHSKLWFIYISHFVLLHVIVCTIPCHLKVLIWIIKWRWFYFVGFCPLAQSYMFWFKMK